jgi:hypothetical protein
VNNTASEFEAILERLREAFQTAYQRGSEAAMRQILSLAQIGGETAYQRGSEAAMRQILSLAQIGGVSKGARGPAPKAVRGKKRRAPRGTAKTLVERVLASGPRTVREISESASSEGEKLLSGSAIRLELERGKRDRRYVNRGGKWSLRGGKA